MADLKSTKVNGNLTVTGEIIGQHSADMITAGTFSGMVHANTTAMSDLGSGQIRNISAGTADLTPGVTAIATGALYFVYE